MASQENLTITTLALNEGTPTQENLTITTLALNEGTPTELPTIVSVWVPKTINKNSVTGLSPLTYSTSNDTSHLTDGQVDGIYISASASRLVQTAIPGLYQVNP